MKTNIAFVKTIPDKIQHLIVYDNIQKDPFIQYLIQFIKIISEEDTEKKSSEIKRLISKMYKILFTTAEKYCLNENIFLKYLYYLILKDENVYSLTSENIQKVNKSLSYGVIYDFEILYDLLKLDIYDLFSKWSLRTDLILNYEPSYHKRYKKISQIEQFLTEPDSPAALQKLISSIYYEFGCGKMLLSSAFRWDPDKTLIPVESTDSITFDKLASIDYQKNILITNTSRFIDGYKANNILLSGARGTGKSSCIKALLQEFSPRGLRIIEIRQKDISSFPNLIEFICNRGGKYIIYIDDISFETFETSYKEVKSVLQGGLDTISENILIYATSNRRHILNRKYDENILEDTELFALDSENEQLSLSDRFGINLQFLTPSQNEYKSIVKTLSKHYNLVYNDDIFEEAEKWAQSGKGRSGRTAEQFIKNYIIQNSSIEKEF